MVGLPSGPAISFYFSVAYKMLQAVYGLWGGSVIILKSESPGIDKWGYGDIECAISFIGYALGNTEDFDEHAVCSGTFSTVYS